MSPSKHPALDEIRRLEERAFNAWPALSTSHVDGWVIRFSEGYTKRANSVNAWMPRIAAPEIAAIAAPLFASQSLPLTFRLSPLAGPDSDARLQDAGFAHLDETIVMTAPLVDLPPDSEVCISPVLADAWAAGFAAANRVPTARRAVHDRMLGAIVAPAAFASLVRADAPVAWGLAVAERGMVGLFDIVTDASVRRQGIARRLVAGLMRWGRSGGATGAYLQVVAGNAPAIALYEQLGFREAYRYHYRIAPQRPLSLG